jgi:hypothetical protein
VRDGMKREQTCEQACAHACARARARLCVRVRVRARAASNGRAARRGPRRGWERTPQPCVRRRQSQKPAAASPASAASMVVSHHTPRGTPARHLRVLRYPEASTPASRGGGTGVVVGATSGRTCSHDTVIMYSSYNSITQTLHYEFTTGTFPTMERDHVHTASRRMP